jgi:hypothetical protein
MTRVAAQVEQRHRSRHSLARHLVATGLSFWTTAAMAQTREQTRVSEDAVAIIGSHRTAATLLQRCATALPGKADVVRQAYSELNAANSGIVAIARNKLYAIAEMTEGEVGRQRLGRMLGDELESEVQKQVAAIANLAAACDGILSRGVKELKTSDRYPQEYARVLRYKIGYAWGLPGCEYQVTFPVQPEVQAIEANGQRTQRAVTPAGTTPTIAVECWPLPLGGAQTAISQAKTSGRKALQDSGVKNLRFQERSTQKGYELDAAGEKSVDGIDMVVTTVLYLGNTSLLEVTVTEAASAGPSLVAAQFLEWVDRPNLRR